MVASALSLSFSSPLLWVTIPDRESRDVRDTVYTLVDSHMCKTRYTTRTERI
jgi:hypothetical protein